MNDYSKDYFEGCQKSASTRYTRFAPPYLVWTRFTCIGPIPQLERVKCCDMKVFDDNIIGYNIVY